MKKTIAKSNFFRCFKIFSIIFIIVSLGYISFSFWNLLVNVFNILVRNYDESIIYVVIIVSLFMIFSLVAVWFIIDILRMLFNKIIISDKMYLIFSVMLMLFIIGLVFIDSTVGVKDLNLILKYEDGSERGNIFCEDSTGRFLVGSKISCNVREKPDLDEIKFTKVIAYLNGTEITDNDISFIAPDDVIYISFKVSGIDKNNNSILLGTGSRFTFLTNEEDKIREEKFTTLMLALFAVVLVTVPSAINNFNSLFKKQNE